jgi:hypothetical protein
MSNHGDWNISMTFTGRNKREHRQGEQVIEREEFHTAVPVY